MDKELLNVFQDHLKPYWKQLYPGTDEHPPEVSWPDFYSKEIYAMLKGAELAELIETGKRIEAGTEPLFSVEEFMNYIHSQDSRGDIAYNCSAEMIRQTNQDKTNEDSD